MDVLKTFSNLKTTKIQIWPFILPKFLSLEATIDLA